MAYEIETVEMPKATWSRKASPLLLALRKMNAGQSVWVAAGDPNYRDSIVSNMNQTDKPKHWFKVSERDGVRIFRDK